VTDTIVILAGGMSSRMKKSQDTELDNEKVEQANKSSKSLITFGNNKPFIFYLLKNISLAGFRNVILLVSKDYESFKNTIEKFNDEFDFNIQFAIQEIPNDRLKPLGTSDAVYQTMIQIPELKQSSFCVCNSDNLYSANAFNLIKNNEYTNAFLAYDRDYLTFPEERVSSFSIVKMDSDNNLNFFIEKPTPEQVQDNVDSSNKIRVSMNIFKFSGEIFKFLENCPLNPIRKEKELPTAIMNMINESSSYMKGIPISEHVPDLTSKSDISEINKLFDL
jgi:NDP-sugar pyrophosphorylase family protein